MTVSRVVHDHCDHCRMTQREPSRERNIELEHFIENWAAMHGFADQWPANQQDEEKRTTVRLARTRGTAPRSLQRSSGESRGTAPEETV